MGEVFFVHAPLAIRLSPHVLHIPTSHPVQLLCLYRLRPHNPRRQVPVEKSDPVRNRCRWHELLADRGYLDLTYLRDIERHGGCFIVRSKAGLHPRVLDAHGEDGQRITSCQDRDFQTITSKFPRRQRAELEVEWLIEGGRFVCA